MCRANFVYTTIVSDSIKRCPLIRSWSLSSSFHVMVLMTFGILIGTVAGRPTAYKRTHADAFRGNLSNDVNAINAYVRNQAAPKVCSFLLDAETADRLSLDGRITVVIRFSSEMLVMRQVIMFNKLESRFRKGGFLNTQFVVVYADGSEATAANATQSRPHTTTSTSGADTTTTGDETSASDDDAAAHDMIERIPTVYNVTVLKENHPVGGSTSRDAAHRSPFAAFEQQACYVFDTCGRLAYIIYYPWSSIHRPFVKAAILSSHFDHPCGKCEVGGIVPFLETYLYSVNKVLYNFYLYLESFIHFHPSDRVVATTHNHGNDTIINHFVRRVEQFQQHAQCQRTDEHRSRVPDAFDGLIKYHIGDQTTGQSNSHRSQVHSERNDR